MKPYKIINPKISVHRRVQLINKLAPSKVPLWFFKNVHLSQKRQIAFDIKE